VVKVDMPLDQVEAFLVAKHGAISDLEPLSGGFWSSAYGYRVGDDALVLRLGRDPEGFEMDRAAMAFTRPDLPVPVVVEVGEAFGGAFAISERHFGRFLEALSPADADVGGPTLVRLLRALRSVPADPGGGVSWHSPDAQGAPSWRQWLSDSLVDDPRHRVSGWRARIAEDPVTDRLFRACERRVRELAVACPERRDLVHRDLLHSNVLVSDDASTVSAVFSWKCSLRGDFLFDVAWCTFWAAWHPGIAALDLWRRVTTEASTPTSPDLRDAELRHHCYELQIGAEHLGWNAWVRDEDALRALAAHTEMVLERGPLTATS
jgi:aminoglycoside phosphotransferase (APT) family kinase protein